MIRPRFPFINPVMRLRTLLPRSAQSGGNRAIGLILLFRHASLTEGSRAIVCLAQHVALFRGFGERGIEFGTYHHPYAHQPEKKRAIITPAMLP
jgi:hypothetical protein